ncbi:HAD family hydrolase [Streptacidiphilus rugosus]|uniref:HAD family hydrolase n=1 Tax=Streptacidiphilus rugosus TaxID=405783 RepID=UPI0012FB850C|nr:HAD-IA family hydrolase [Streptacidiphilus rugosus]
MTDHVVLWDFDGTLATRQGMWRGCLVEALSAVSPGHGVTGDDVGQWLNEGFPWHDPDAGHPSLDTPDLWWDALRPVLLNAYLRTGVGSAVASQAAELVRGCYTDPTRWTVFPDTVAVLEELAGTGWRHIVVSNHVPELDALMEALGLRPYFEAVVNSALTGWEKPNPRIFEAALQQAGHPERVWMVGDNPTADIAGAHAAGIPGILVAPDGTGLKSAVRQIKSQTNRSAAPPASRSTAAFASPSIPSAPTR